MKSKFVLNDCDQNGTKQFLIDLFSSILTSFLLQLYQILLIVLVFGFFSNWLILFLFYYLFPSN